MKDRELAHKMSKKIWVNKVDSFHAAQEFDIDYYLSMSRTERLETVQFLRETFLKMKKGLANESGKGLRRVIKVIEQK